MAPKALTIRDEIHGDMVFDPLIEVAINHPCFQRLRHIKQLGLADFVFPCATHTRFQHSMGAAFLAGEYFENLIKSWLNPSFKFDCSVDGTRFFPKKTHSTVESVHHDIDSRFFWKQLIQLAGLLHDVGHGPWSHTFENLPIPQNFHVLTSLFEGRLSAYYEERDTRKKPLKHEDISVLYIHKILRDLQDQGAIGDARTYFLPLVTLVHRKLLVGHWGEQIQEELANLLEEKKIVGGLDFHRLLRPIISGPFDVDRIDYIQRDGRNCGVSIGAIEWRRIVTKLLPCLAEYKGSNEEPQDVVLITSVKNQHVLDDFVFSLFQMYTQVYLHPKIVGLEAYLKEKLAKSKSLQKGLIVDFEMHRRLTDEKLRDILAKEFEIEDVEAILLRRPERVFEVASSTPGSGLEKELTENGFERIPISERPMMKESMGVYLYNNFKWPVVQDVHRVAWLTKWQKNSPIAEHFSSVNYAPDLWLRKSGEKESEVLQLSFTDL